MKGLYIHIPFCKQKCLYCDFLSFTGKEDIIDKYLDALGREMLLYKGAEIDTVFIGGGTPSVLSAQAITHLVNMIKETFYISPDAEFTMEVNPGTANKDKIRAMYEGGINRVSVGVQSFDDKELQAIGRIHNSDTAINTVNELYESGFENISVDLMMSLPYQTEDSFKNNLYIAVNLPVKHISVYSLIIEENTPIYNKYKLGEYAEPSEEMDRYLYKFTKDYLKEKGFCRYEISNYAKDGYESKHNLKYWECDEYIGVGLGAHSYVGNARYSNTEDIEKYLSGDFCDAKETLDDNEKMGEFMILGLRKCDGVDDKEFKKRFGISMFSVYEEAIDKFIEKGAMVKTEDRCCLTDYGFDISNTVMCEFL